MTFDHPAPQHRPQLLALWKTAFGDFDGFWETFLSTACRPDRCYCALDGETVTAALYVFDCTQGQQKLAYLYAVATHPDYRNQGFCRRLLDFTHSRLAQSGYAAALLVPETVPLRQMYQSLGYQNATSVTEFTCTAADRSIPLRAIGPREYAALRRSFLPWGGVLQEGENLAFLATQAQFYAGEDFLLTAWQEGTTLHAPELLGDPAVAPGILQSLHCTQGHFRTPGASKPFAMYHPLTETAVPPAYFGLAYD